MNQGNAGHLGHPITDCATSHTNLPHLATLVSVLTPVSPIKFLTAVSALSHAQIVLSPNPFSHLGVIAGSSPKALSCSLPTVLPSLSPHFSILPTVLGAKDAKDLPIPQTNSAGLFLDCWSSLNHSITLPLLASHLKIISGLVP